jgi:hypothetical protein
VALAGGGRHEGGDVEPFVAVMAEGDRPLPGWRASSAARMSALFF